jgi:NTP pyrophosphatase (non-canonical NTP hydrolase)
MYNNQYSRQIMAMVDQYGMPDYSLTEFLGQLRTIANRIELDTDKADFLQRVRAAIDTRSANEFKSGGVWTTEQWLVALGGEYGELCNLVKKQWRDGGIAPEQIEHEFADVFIYLIAFAIHMDFDIEQIVTRKFNITSEKRGYSTKL